MGSFKQGDEHSGSVKSQRVLDVLLVGWTFSFSSECV